MAKPHRLEDLIDGEFAEGYAQFRQLAETAADEEALPLDDRLAIFLTRIMSVAMVEGLNRAEEKFETSPAVNVVQVWRATGIALATINAQAFRREGFGKVRREMRDILFSAYGSTMKHMIAAAGESEESAP